MVLLEAMACARPIVCSDLAGYRTTVGDAGAVLVPPGRPAELAEAIARLARDVDRRARMGRLNLARARAYDWDTLAHRVRDAYLSAMAAGRRPALARLAEDAS